MRGQHSDPDSSSGTRPALRENRTCVHRNPPHLSSIQATPSGEGTGAPWSSPQPAGRSTLETPPSQFSACAPPQRSGTGHPVKVWTPCQCRSIPTACPGIAGQSRHFLQTSLVSPLGTRTGARGIPAPSWAQAPTQARSPDAAPSQVP